MLWRIRQRNSSLFW